MSVDEELDIPAIPVAKPDDPEDVSWALSTAGAMWARGEHLEGIKWARKAAEAAGDADRDARALELAKAASELTMLIARRSRASVDDAQLTRSAPPLPADKLPEIATPSKPVPVKPPPPLPPASNHPKSSQVPHAPLSFQLLEVDSGMIETADPAPPSTVDSASGARDSTARSTKRESLRAILEATAVGAPVEVPTVTARSKLRDPIDPKFAEQAEPVFSERHKSTMEWDMSPTQNLTGDEMDQGVNRGDRATTAFALPVAVPSPVVTVPVPRVTPNAIHDPHIQTSQAVRVLVWRDANGVHLAPAGTVVSAITIDAVLVALEPSADLTAWLSKRER